MPNAKTAPPISPRVGLFVTCLVDLMRPSVGFASAALLEEAGCIVDVPRAQSCCGQPAWNSGDKKHARAVARTVLAAFKPHDYIVAPSGSCAATIAKDYPLLFKGEPEEAEALEIAAKTHELVSFLRDVMGLERVSAHYKGTVTYHDSCSGLRSLNIKDQPRALLESVEGLELREMNEAETCCGFGGTFCVKFPEISNVMVRKKTRNIKAAKADLLLAGDLGCLMNMQGKLAREGRPVKARHIAEMLAGHMDGPAIGEEKA